MHSSTNRPGLYRIRRPLSLQWIARPGRHMPKIFISYRREDSRHATGRIYDRLSGVFGEHNVFKDVDSLPLGVDFRRELNDQVARCDVLLAIMGDDWLAATDAAGKPRLADEADFVRIELEAALKRDIPVVPILVGDTVEVPMAKDLPEPLAGLAFRNGTRLRDDPFFHTDMERLIRALQQLRGGPSGAMPADADVIIAESVAPGGTPAAPLYSSGPWHAHPPQSPAMPHAPPQASSGTAAVDSIDWFALFRWLVMAILAPAGLIIGVLQDDFRLGFTLFFAGLPLSLGVGLFPPIYQRLWQWNSGLGTQEYARHKRTMEGALIYAFCYGMTQLMMVVVAFTVFSVAGYLAEGDSGRDNSETQKSKSVGDVTPMPWEEFPKDDGAAPLDSFDAPGVEPIAPTPEIPGVDAGSNPFESLAPLFPPDSIPPSPEKPEE